MARPLALLLSCLLLVACGGAGEQARELRSGSGYVVELPPGWEDISEEQRLRIEQSFDRIFAGDARSGFRTNVNVIVRSRPPGSLGELAERAREEVRSGDDSASEITRPRERRLGGERAAVYGYRLQRRSPPLRGQTLLCPRGDRLYLVTLTAPADGFREAQAEFERLLDSWQWD